MASRIPFLICLLLLVATFATTPNIRSVDRSTSAIEIDNEHVTVRRNIHAPHANIPMHSHAAGVIVYLTDVQERSIAPDGTSKKVFHKAGDVLWAPARQHALENLSDHQTEVIEIEMKQR